MKYLLYRSFGNLEKDVKKHELVAVEYGKDIGDVTDALIKAAADDLAGMPEYEHCETAAYAPEPIKDFRKVLRYQYEMTGKLLHSLFSMRNNRRITASLFFQLLFLAMCHVLAYGSLKHSAGKLCSTDNQR